MNDENNELLIRLCCDVFENLSFMFGETIDFDEAETKTISLEEWNEIV